MMEKQQVPQDMNFTSGCLYTAIRLRSAQTHHVTLASVLMSKWTIWPSSLAWTMSPLSLYCCIWGSQFTSASSSSTPLTVSIRRLHTLYIYETHHSKVMRNGVMAAVLFCILDTCSLKSSGQKKLCQSDPCISVIYDSRNPSPGGPDTSLEPRWVRDIHTE